VFEASDGVGGTWHLNRYPGARCDLQSYVYCYSFSQDLWEDWQWSGKYPTQPSALLFFLGSYGAYRVRCDQVAAAYYGGITLTQDRRGAVY
jgi:cation diffusion facilitator CzcD-associated flavoprotein CzcO